MPIRSNQVTVTAAATRLDVFSPVTGSSGQSVHISVRNASPSTSVWVGGAAVVAASGYEIPPSGTLAVDVTPPDGLWGRTTAGNAVCQILMTNVQ